MIGNVEEWVYDKAECPPLICGYPHNCSRDWNEPCRILRGCAGYSSSSEHYCSLNIHEIQEPGISTPSQGFRLVRTAGN